MVSENKKDTENDIAYDEITQEENVRVLEKINLNTSTAEELSDLIYISDEQASLIVDYRNKHGDFNEVKEVCSVKGITMSTVNIIQKYTYVD